MGNALEAIRVADTEHMVIFQLTSYRKLLELWRAIGILFGILAVKVNISPNIVEETIIDFQAIAFIKAITNAH